MLFQHKSEANILEEKKSEVNLFYACQSIPEQKDEQWYIDSAYSNYMTMKEDFFLSMNTSFYTKVRMGNGALVEVKENDTIGVQRKRGVEKNS